jgi:glucose uptake protein GlcU
MKLSTLSVVLGLVVVLVQLYALTRPREFIEGVRKFPRSLPWGYLLMAVGTLGFFYYLKQESISDFERFKPLMFAAFGLIAVGVCVFVSDFLAVRGLAITILVLAKLMVDTARWHESPWRWVITSWAYVLVIAGIWFTISPWRCRDLVNWATASEKRVRALSCGRLAFGVLVVILGLAVF